MKSCDRELSYIKGKYNSKFTKKSLYGISIGVRSGTKLNIIKNEVMKCGWANEITCEIEHEKQRRAMKKQEQ